MSDSKKPRMIMTRSQLRELAKELGVRHDWHEPDEQEVEAIVFGDSFDNAGFWGRGFREDMTRELRASRQFEEMSVMLVKGGKPVAEINLASLFAMACGTWDGY